MTSTFDIRWVGLLTGRYFKYLASPRTEIGVKVFGMIHGLVFIGLLITAVPAGIAYSWSARTWLLALLGSIVPLGSVIFLIWADRRAELGTGSGSRPGGFGPGTDVTNLRA